MGNTSSSYLGTTDTGLGSVGRGGASSQTAGPLQVARDRLRRRQRGTALASQMDGVANTLTTQGAASTETSTPINPFLQRLENPGQATSLLASQFGIMVRNAQTKDDRLMRLTRGNKPMNVTQRRSREQRFRGYERGEF